MFLRLLSAENISRKVKLANDSPPKKKTTGTSIHHSCPFIRAIM